MVDLTGHTVVLVTGPRTFTAVGAEMRRLDRAYYAPLGAAPVTLIHGNCRGADQTCAAIAAELGWGILTFPYPGWLRRGGGPVRNGWMVRAAVIFRDLGARVEVRAFGDGTDRGTSDCARQAAQHGLEVIWVQESLCTK